MGAVRLENVTKQYGGRVVLDQISLELHDGEIAGIVGPNGAGKTTLFKLILGRIEPDYGAITRTRGLSIGYLPQEPELNPDATLHDEVAGAFAELLALEQQMHALSAEIAAAGPGPQQQERMRQYERLEMQFIADGGYSMEQRVAEILGGLGFSPQDHALKVSALSGGQKCRAALARLLLVDSSLLLLDEPTNHLDIDAVRWLEKFLRTHKGGAAIISHDRFLLDRVCDRVIELENARLTSYPGNYSNYMETRELRRLTQQRQFEKDKAFIEKERAYIAKYLAGQRSSQAKGRRTRLEARLSAGEFVLDTARERPTIQFDFSNVASDGPKGRPLLRAAGLAKQYGERSLFKDVGLEIAPGQRVGITGPNGAGKSTLLKALVGELEPDAGRIDLDAKAHVGYYAQSAADLDPQRTIVAEIQAARPDLTEARIRGLLGRFLFRGDDVFKLIGSLSGGEQSRVRLVKLLLLCPNLLVLDEPTNHLDIPAREALEEALVDYPGAILTVSHDRYFLDQIVDSLIVMRGGTHRAFKGNYTSYVEQIEAEQRAEAARKPPTPVRPARAASTTSAGEANGKPAKRTRGKHDRLSLEELEAQIMEWESKISELTAQFGDVERVRDPAKLLELEQSLAAARNELSELEQAWGRKVEEAK